MRCLGPLKLSQFEHRQDIESAVQAYQARYVPDVCHMLLKWKPASHNSVDFTLLPASDPLVCDDPACEQALTDGQEYFLAVFGDSKLQLAFDLDHARLKRMSPSEPLIHALTGTPARVQFPGGEDPDELLQLVIECNFDVATHSWCFMRDRTKHASLPLPTKLLAIVSICLVLFLST
jgi:hypothetical protein